MTTGTAFASTPCYVLKSGNRPIAPTIHSDDTQCVCVYGFSDKPVYDQFIQDADELLTPYPLVKGYLSNQIESAGSAGEALQLVILDACAEAQPVLAAATMEAVLAARQNDEDQVPVAFELIFDVETNSYRFR